WERRKRHLVGLGLPTGQAVYECHVASFEQPPRFRITLRGWHGFEYLRGILICDVEFRKQSRECTGVWSRQVSRWVHFFQLREPCAVNFAKPQLFRHLCSIFHCRISPVSSCEFRRTARERKPDDRFQHRLSCLAHSLCKSGPKASQKIIARGQRNKELKKPGDLEQCIVGHYVAGGEGKQSQRQRRGCI